MKWMVRFAHGDRLAIGFHSIPRDAYGRPLQSESQLGTYRSSGCVRQADHKAQALYAWAPIGTRVVVLRSEEHTSELQSLMRISYAVFCLKKKKTPTQPQ